MKRIIYIYSTNTYYNYRKEKGDLPLIKIGDTTQYTSDERIQQQDSTSNPEPLIKLYDIEIPDNFLPNIEHVDKHFHKFLESKSIFKYRKDKDREWFEIELDDAIKYLNEFVNGIHRLNNYSMREPQQEAHDKIVKSFSNGHNKFLLAAKMRFGKNFTLLNVIKTLGYKNILVMTYKPHVFDSLKDDIENHINFDNFRYINLKDDRQLKGYNSNNVNIIVSSAQLAGYSEYENNSYEEYLSIQDNLILKNIKLIDNIKFDLILVDEYHYGASTTKFNEILSKINYKKIIYISGTAFRDLNNGTFLDDEVYNYDYIDECKYQEYIKNTNIKKYNIIKLPKLNMYGISLTSDIINEAHKYYTIEEYPKFSKIFEANDDYKFVNDSLATMTLANILGKTPGKNVSPFKNIRNIERPKHIFMTCVGVNSGTAICNKINELYNNEFYAINACGNNIVDVSDLKREINEAKKLNKISITVSCVRFKEGVSIKEWNSIILLDDCVSPVSYFQTIFRGQTPNINKDNFYVYDYNPDRMLSMNYFANETQAILKDKNVYEYIKEYLDCVNIFTFDTNHKLNEVDFISLQNAISKSNIERNLFESTSLVNIDNLKYFEYSNMLNDVNNVSSININVTDNGLSGGKKESVKKLLKQLNVKSNKDKKTNIKDLLNKIKSLLKHLPEIMFLTDTNEHSFNDIINAINNNEEYKNIVSDILECDSEILNYIKESNIINELFINRIIIAYVHDEEEFFKNKTIDVYNIFFGKWFRNTKTIVRTPINVIERMFNNINEDIYKNPNFKFCDFACKESSLLLYIKNKLLKYHSEEHIINNMLYACCINKYNENEIKKVLGLKNSNIYRIISNEDSILYYKNNFKNIKIEDMPKFDFIVQNPPYKGKFHLEFFNLGYDILNDNGKMVIIEPSTWLINLQETNHVKKHYNPLKEKTKYHIYKVIFENYNKEFNTGIFMPFAITYIDKSNIYKEIEFENCGIKNNVNSIYDCNLIGDYNKVKSILNKCLNYNNMMYDHIYNEKKHYNENNLFIRIPNVFNNHGYYSNVDYVKHFQGEFYYFYTSPALHKDDHNIYNYIPKTRTGNLSGCLFNTSKNELENWKYFILNNKLPLFINMCVQINEANNGGKYIPWIVNKQYTDDEIYNILNINKEEQKFIDETIKRFERNSEWFKRYMCGI